MCVSTLMAPLMGRIAAGQLSSCSSEPAGFAAVAGCRRTVLDESCPAWFGARLHGAQEAELTAVCVALLWTLSLHGLRPFSLCTDLLVTVQRAHGSWNFPASHALATSCRALAQASEVYGLLPWMCISHVRAHAGDCWNELADSLAKVGATSSAPPSSCLTVGPWVQCGVLHTCGSSLMPSGNRFCGLHSMMMLCAPLSAMKSSLLRLSSSWDIVLARATKGGWARLNIASMNVQTMEGDGILSDKGRACFFREQMAAVGAHVVLVQEARTPKTASVLSESYVRLRSGRTASGQLGVEAWFRRAGVGDSTTFRSEDLTVILFDPRILAVRVRALRFRGVIVSIHAPTSADPGRLTWWEELSQTLARLASRTQAIGMSSLLSPDIPV